jgi:hypothetical protein
MDEISEAMYREIEQLPQMPMGELRERYRQVFGEPTRSQHKQHLVRRIAWRLQVLAQGDLSERARPGAGPGQRCRSQGAGPGTVED